MFHVTCLTSNMCSGSVRLVKFTHMHVQSIHPRCKLKILVLLIYSITNHVHLLQPEMIMMLVMDSIIVLPIWSCCGLFGIFKMLEGESIRYLAGNVPIYCGFVSSVCDLTVLRSVVFCRFINSNRVSCWFPAQCSTGGPDRFAAIFGPINIWGLRRRRGRDGPGWPDKVWEGTHSSPATGACVYSEEDIHKMVQLLPGKGRLPVWQHEWSLWCDIPVLANTL